jgi:hypothetical protein
MTRDKAIAAVDEALAQSVRDLFDVLVRNLVAQEPDAPARFHKGMAFRDQAYSTAIAEVEKIFPE